MATKEVKGAFHAQSAEGFAGEYEAADLVGGKGGGP